VATQRKTRETDQKTQVYGRNVESPQASEAEREAAWLALEKLWADGGFRSDGPYPTRDELYDEMTAEHIR